MENRLVHANNSPENIPCFGIDNRRRKAKEKRCLGCLPTEILLTILSDLSVVDYASFPCVCKCWRSAFLLCSPLLSSQERTRDLPWFVITKLDPNSKELITTGKIGDLCTRRIHTSNIPELYGSRILLSRHGWLLLFSSKNKKDSLFFLNPFSRARIDIPLLDDMLELTCPVFDTSAPPTSPDCIVFVLSGWGVRKISTCRRGESKWQTNIFKRCATSPVVNTVFADGVLYCFHEHGFLTTFDVVTRSCEEVIEPEFYGPGLVSHACQRDNRVYLCVYDSYSVEYEVELKRHPTITMSNCIPPEWAFHRVQITVYNKSPELRLDTFSARAWCMDTDKNDGHITFMWHDFKSCKYYRYIHPKNKDCSMFVMWVQPIWVDRSSTNLSWMS